LPSIIDTPIESLPHVDEHSVEVRATEPQTWDALVATLPRMIGGPLVRIFNPVWHLEHPEATGEFGTIGSTLPGFVVARSVRPAVLALLGQHRFSRYALIFRIEKTDAGVRLRAETRADFPGAKGRVYRGLVIGTRGHVVAVRRMLGTVKSRAERR
jgi:hypothetical protein